MPDRVSGRAFALKGIRMAYSTTTVEPTFTFE